MNATPAELVRDAVAALEECEADPTYEVDMDYFHVRFVTADSSSCKACLAGAWAAKRRGLKGNLLLPAHAGEYADECQALDMFRQGRLRSGLQHLGLWHGGLPYPRGLRQFIPVRRYMDSAKKFKRDLLSVAENLEKANVL